MKKILLLPLFILLLSLISCFDRTDEDFKIISNNKVDGYDIYEYEHRGLFCNQYFEEIYYSGETYNYGFSFEGCSADKTFFIKSGEDYIYLRDALDLGMITLKSLIPELEQFERDSEEIQPEEADYYWLGFFIDGDVVYAYAGGECAQQGEEVFVIDGTTYVYRASGCLKNHILFMQVDGEYISVSTLISNGQVDAKYLIPLLEEKTD